VRPEVLYLFDAVTEKAIPANDVSPVAVS